MLGIVILNYNTWKETVNCIKSIETVNLNEIFKIYVVDNKSTERPTVEELTYLESNPHVNIIYSKVNNGYSAGNNIGFDVALNDNCDYILLCNSDIVFVDNTIDKMIDYIVQNNDVGIIGPQIYNSNNEFQPFYMLKKLTAVGKIKNMFLHTPFRVCFKKFENNFIRRTELITPKQVFGVSGCCFLLSKECLEYLFPFDENTFLYEEEYILGSRLENSKFKVCIIPDTHVIHAHGASTHGMTEFSYNCLINSEQYYMKRYLRTNILLRKVILLIRIMLKKRYVKKGSTQ